MLAHIGMWAAVVAALGLLKYAIGQKDGWWRLILIIVVLGGVAIGLLWVLGADGKLGRHVGAASRAATSVARAQGSTEATGADTAGLCRKSPNAALLPYSEDMSTPRIRMTMVVMDILDVLINTPPDDPAWGLKLCEQTGHGTGTVYPALDRLLKAGWIEDRWEDPPPEDRPRRRYYAVTAAGRAAYQEAVAGRAARRAAWAIRAAHAGGAA